MVIGIGCIVVGVAMLIVNPRNPDAIIVGITAVAGGAWMLFLTGGDRVRWQEREKFEAAKKQAVEAIRCEYWGVPVPLDQFPAGIWSVGPHTGSDIRLEPTVGLGRRYVDLRDDPRLADFPGLGGFVEIRRTPGGRTTVTRVHLRDSDPASRSRPEPPALVVHGESH